MKTYKIYEETHWDSNGCSCCEPTPYEIYRVEGEEISMSSYSDVLERLLQQHGVQVELIYEEDNDNQ